MVVARLERAIDFWGLLEGNLGGLIVVVIYSSRIEARSVAVGVYSIDYSK
jgi:hypothetical protein